MSAPLDFPDWSNNQTYTAKTILSGLAPVSGAPVTLDITPYASLMVRLSTVVSVSVLTLTFIDASGNPVAQEIMGVAVGGLMYVELPTQGVSVTVSTVNGGAPPQIQISGTNRQTSGIRSVNNSSVPRVLSYAGAFVAGIPVALTAADGGTNFTTLSGLCQLVSRADSGAGEFGFNLITQQGSSTQVDVLDVTAVTPATIGQVILPVTPVTWVFTPVATAAGGNAFLWLIPQVG